MLTVSPLGCLNLVKELMALDKERLDTVCKKNNTQLLTITSALYRPIFKILSLLYFLDNYVIIINLCTYTL